jgi:MoaA/NifB/PqqE/SkfB family radical SAM enzyme
MQCNHCFDNASPDGKHMSFDTFRDSLKFISRSAAKMVLLTGGEPSEHPQFIEIAELVKRRMEHPELLIIASNGMFLHNEQYAKEILSLGIQIQITNDKRFYPQTVPVVDHKNLCYITEIGHLFPIGRAITNNLNMDDMDIKLTYPKCFNARSIIRSGYIKNFQALMKFYELKLQKFCIPSIDINGGVHLGETDSCLKIGTIHDDMDVLFDNIKSMKIGDCNNCGLEDNLEGKFRDALSLV